MLFQPATLNKHFAEASSIAYLRAFQISVNPQTNPFCFFLSRLNGTTFEPRTLKNNWEQFWTPRDSGSMGKHFWRKKFCFAKKIFWPQYYGQYYRVYLVSAHFGVQQKRWVFNTINGSCGVGATYEQRNTITNKSLPKRQRCVLACKFLHYLWLHKERREHGVNLE